MKHLCNILTRGSIGGKMTRGPDDCAQRPVDRVRPAWSNVYNRVVVDLTTHEAGGITQKDLDLAREMEEMARSI
jgi:hypothetical protein